MFCFWLEAQALYAGKSLRSFLEDSSGKMGCKESSISLESACVQAYFPFISGLHTMSYCYIRYSTNMIKKRRTKICVYFVEIIFADAVIDAVIDAATDATTGIATVETTAE